MMAVSKKARAAMETSKSMLKAARKYAGTHYKDLALEHYIHAASWAGIALQAAPRKEEMFRVTAVQLYGEAQKEAAALCGIKKNPSTEAEGAAIAGGAGALLLGPLGAIAGAYLGAKAARPKKKKKAAKKNPNRGSGLRRMMRGT